MTTQNSSDYILDTSREYSIYVCENRAIPKVADGLKDAQRKALWLIKSKQDKIKTVSLAGEMISSGLYLHGDASAAGSISMLAAPYANNVPLLDGIGQFGTRVSPVEGIGAPRYTYVKRGKAATELMFPDINIVPLRENYDGSTKEPVHFLPLIPTVLLNGVSGIAVAWSTEILPRDIGQLVQACLDVLSKKKLKRIAPHYAAYNVQVKHLLDNTWELSGRVEIEDTSTLRVTELPPDVTLAKFKERLNTMEDEGKISTYTDRSTKQIDITIKMARGSLKGWTEEKALDFFKIRQKKTERIVVVDWNGSSIRQYDTAEEVIESFVKWRLGWYTTRYETMKSDDEYELVFWKAVKACFDDKLPARLGAKKDKNEIITDIDAVAAKTKLALDDKRRDRIVNLPTYRWAADAYTDVIAQIKKLEANIVEYTTILGDPKLIENIYREELMALKSAKL